MPILDPGARQIAYTLEGPPDAPVLVLSNSLGTTMSMWDAQAAALAGAYRVLRYDTRGHGGSGAADAAAVATPDATADATADCALAQLGGDVLRLLDGLGIERASFCGISMGGLTGLWLGIHAGHRLERLVVANSAARIGTGDAWRARAAQVAASGMDTVADGACGRWFTADFARRESATVDVLVEGLRRTPPPGYAACCLALQDADLRDAIDAIRVPTLLIAGRHDPVTTVEDAKFMRARIPGARCAVLDASHLSNIEAADEFTRALAAFLH